MNYYEHHIGDYAKDAGHLSMLEEGAYRRLLDAYYTRERALPADLRDCCKLAKAASKAEREAVAYILREFFVLREDGHHQNRADEEIVRYADKRSKAKASIEKRWEKVRTINEGNTDVSNNENSSEIRTYAKRNTPRARPQSPVTSKELEDQNPKIPAGKQRASRTLIKTWLAALGDSDAIAPDDPIFDYADVVGIPEDFLRLSWKRFVEDMTERGTLKTNWRAHYRNAVRGNWFKLWWFPSEGQCALTTTGEQARRAA